MGAEAPQYPETLVNVAKLAFARRPALSLRLIGVVESKSALTGRIKHILNRPLPKTARLGVAGLASVFLSAVLLLPMAQAKRTAADPDAFTAVLPNGVMVELLGICDYPSEGKQWWRPDGSPLEEAPYDKRGAWVSPNDRNKAPFELALRVRNLPENWEAGSTDPRQ